jgi:translation initiation factor 2 alpha subunit (eIF-2alpha)
LKRRFKKSVVKSIAIFKVSVVKLFDGIIKLKEILKAGAEASKAKDYDVKITILGAPDYLCEISTATKE